MAVQITTLSNGKVKVVGNDSRINYYDNSECTVRIFEPDRVQIIRNHDNTVLDTFQVADITTPAGAWTPETICNELNKNPYFYDPSTVVSVPGVATSALQQSLEDLLIRDSLFERRSGATSAIVKSGPGILKRVVLGDNKGTSLTLYDNTSAVAPIISIINILVAGGRTIEFDLPFTTGLFAVTVGVNCEATIIYQ